MRAAYILAVFVIFAGCSPPWDTVTSVEGGYSIEMPSLFIVEQLLPVTTAFGSVNYQLVGSDPTRFKKFWPFWSGHGPYVVAHADLPLKKYSEDAIRRLFDNERDRLYAEAKRADKKEPGLTKIILDKPILFGVYPGREVSITFSDARTSHTRMYFVEGRFYILYGMGKNLDTFFNSFNLLS
ncbi:hypothetical protein D1BOALGB6SA_3339 [Olavius sp. associated proteobacterium Delta 1]|nr:hypothetical protein D1BOALGB6SA_3339 [Olavius sp. associated proteobacterium Delta 1]